MSALADRHAQTGSRRPAYLPLVLATLPAQISTGLMLWIVQLPFALLGIGPTSLGANVWVPWKPARLVVGARPRRLRADRERARRRDWSAPASPIAGSHARRRRGRGSRSAPPATRRWRSARPAARGCCSRSCSRRSPCGCSATASTARRARGRPGRRRAVSHFRASSPRCSSPRCSRSATRRRTRSRRTAAPGRSRRRCRPRRDDGPQRRRRRDRAPRAGHRGAARRARGGPGSRSCAPRRRARSPAARRSPGPSPSALPVWLPARAGAWLAVGIRLSRAPPARCGSTRSRCATACSASRPASASRCGPPSGSAAAAPPPTPRPATDRAHRPAAVSDRWRSSPGRPRRSRAAAGGPPARAPPARASPPPDPTRPPRAAPPVTSASAPSRCSASTPSPTCQRSSPCTRDTPSATAVSPWSRASSDSASWPTANAIPSSATWSRPTAAAMLLRGGARRERRGGRRQLGLEQSPDRRRRGRPGRRAVEPEQLAGEPVEPARVAALVGRLGGEARPGAGIGVEPRRRRDERLETRRRPRARRRRSRR